MHNTDARRLDAKTLTELRKRAVKAVQKGQSPTSVASTYGVTKQTVYNWIALYRSGGSPALNAKKRGGGKRLLDGRAMRWVYETLRDKDPRQVKFPFALWTCAMVGTLIYRKFGVKLSRWSVMRLLRHLGLSPQRPMWRAHQQDPEAVLRWVREEYPKIRYLAKRRGAVIYFGDEAGVRSDHHAGTTWGVRGKTPIVSTTGARFGINMMSAVSPRGHFRFMLIKGRVGAKEVVRFLRRLIHGHRRPIFLILDRHPAHRAKLVRSFVASTKGRLEIFFLPPYSPERNPDEYVWNDLKGHVGRSGICTPAEMRRTVLGRLRHLASSPAKVRGFFRTPDTAYAAS